MLDWLAPVIGNIAGGLMGRDSARDMANANIQNQMLFAKKGIQWKVADAKKAGIHPLYALGAQTHQFSPVSVGDPLPDAISQAGQNIGRAYAATGTNEQRLLQGLQLENAQLQNDFLRAKIGQIQRDQIGPAVPQATHSTGNMIPLIPGQGVGLEWAGAPGWSELPSTAVVTPAQRDVQEVKIGGYHLMRDPSKYSSGQAIQNEYDEHVAGAAGIFSAFESWVRAMERAGYLTAPHHSREYRWADTMRKARAMRDRQHRPWGE